MDKLNLLKASESQDHISRHTDSTSLNIGSKTIGLSQEQTKSILEQFDKQYASLIEKEGNPGRKVFALECNQAVGTDAVVPLSGLTNEAKEKTFSITRDIGTPYEQTVNAVLISKEDMPKTNVVHGIYGPYGPTGDAGIYTMVYGDEGMPFAKELKGDEPEGAKEFNNKCKEYWDNHVFLVTPEELANNVSQMKEAGRDSKPLELRLKRFNNKVENGEYIKPTNGTYKSKVSQNAINITPKSQDKGRSIVD